MMDQTSEVQPVVTDADVGEQGNALAGVVSTAPAEAVSVNTTQDLPSGAESYSPQNSTVPSGSDKEGLLLRLHTALDDLEAKIGNGIHVFAHEVAALRDLVKAVI